MQVREGGRIKDRTFVTEAGSMAILDARSSVRTEQKGSLASAPRTALALTPVTTTVLVSAFAAILAGVYWFLPVSSDGSSLLLLSLALIAVAGLRVELSRMALALTGAIAVATALWSAWAAMPPSFWFSALAFLIVLSFLWRRAPKEPGASGDVDGHSRVIAEELNLLIDGTQDYAIYMLDRDGRVTIWNQGAERLIGWSEEEMVGQSAALFYPSDSVEAGRPEADLDAARGRKKIELDDWRVRKDGSEFLAHVSIQALHDEDGTLRGFATIVRDITDQKAAESALQTSENHLRSILSTVPDAMIVIDDRGTMLSFSTAAERLFGYDQSEVVGSNVSMLMPSPDRERHDGYLERYLRTGEKRIIGIGRVVFAARKDGTTFPMELSVGEATGEGQQLFTGFIRDITDRQRTQEKLEELQSELIHVARVSAMGTMASTLAHELNQPITAVANYVEAVRDLLAAPDPEDLPMIREALQDAAGEAMRAGHIVRRLRDFVARGEVEKTVEKLPLLINEAAAFGLMGAIEKSVEARFDIDHDAADVLVDKIQIQQVLVNLIRNAVEAMSQSEERVLTVCSEPDQPGYVRVTVADTGPGVAPEVAAQLFTAFVSTKTEGMGLGLSICRTIVEANGGRIWMEPRKDGGTQFHFTLVRAEPEKLDGR